MDIVEVRNRFHEVGTIIRDMMLESRGNTRLEHQLHQLINHLLVIKGNIEHE